MHSHFILRSWLHQDLGESLQHLNIFCPQPDYSEDQQTEMEESLLYKAPVDPANWVGLRKSDDLLDYLKVSNGNIHQLKVCYTQSGENK